MRTHFLRTTSWLVPGLLLGTLAFQHVNAAERTASLVSEKPPVVARRAAAIVLPPPPPAPVVLDRADVTGSIASESGDNAGQGARAQPVLSPALSFDDAGRATGRVVEGSPAATLDATTAPAVPTTSSPEPQQQAATPAQSGLTIQAIDEALPAFVNGGVPGETRAQAEERRRVRQAVATYYAAHADHPLWIADGHLTAAARSVMERLDHASEDALDLGGYAVPVPRNAERASLVRAELALSEAAVAYGRQASGSRVDIARLGGTIDSRPQVADADEILGTVPAAADPGATLQAFNPVQPGYVALREKLAELRQHSAVPEAQNRIPAGPALKLGMSDARVPLIRARFGLGVGDDSSASSLVYDTKVAAAVAGFQRANGLPASGVLTTRTVAALSGGNPTRLESAIIANMEEWRWMPRNFAPDHIEVNIPEYEVRVFRDGQMTHETRVVVGQPDKPTPVFSQVMKFIIVNPYWNVPLSIIKKDMLPKLASDPNYFADHGYEVIERNGATFVRQPPGDSNALGRIKFMFPNDHAVYLHDTNARSFFQRDMRALSHGCVRVEDPFAFAEAVLGRDRGWSQARVKKLIGGNEHTINLPKPLPIHIVYFTAFVDPARGFQVRTDVYGYTGKIEAALGLPT